ncbi:MBG domain-containing protein [Actomonas aquatica]|uniref:MBG domain-containing protein n=1 Tax=Actomonas aquatica TaxID=2866162 RepID=A0ABZ1CDV5_9BACT|nr:MBG domain-containing protein [Opitutus sp. WL0086]WRQ89864.1 MBG domain-containing protein [Opitutus sp. WL0086]
MSQSNADSPVTLLPVARRGIRSAWKNRRRVVGGLLLSSLLAGPVAALPEGGEVVAGDVTIDAGANTLNLTQLGDAAIVNWADFSIAAGEVVNITQDSAQAALLNRVLGANPSELLGQLNASGRVYLINPNGVVVGKDASINAMEFVASALDVTDQDFLDGGDLNFAGESTAGVLNLGKITAENGDVILIAYTVANEGEIAAANGIAGLAAGREVVLSPQGDQRLLVKTSVGADAAEVGVANAGVIDAAQAELKAAGGSLYELAINQSGIVRATGVAHRDGRILLTAEGGELQHSGTLAARNADGSGGEVLLGGDFRGQNAAVANAARTTVTADAVIDVSAAADSAASAGRAIVWADEQTDFAGFIDGRAGGQGGHGAFAEVSGKQILNYRGLADLTAVHGLTGMLWLDPDEAIISSATDDQPNGVFNTAVLAANLATANVTIDTSSAYGNGFDVFGDITVNDAVTWTSGSSLILKSGDNINVNADLTGGSGSAVIFELGVGGRFAETTGNLTVDSGATVTADTVSIRQNADAAPAGSGNLPPSGFEGRVMGAVAFDGVLNTQTLDLALNEGGIGGAVTIANAANAIGMLTTSDATPAAIGGAVHIVDGSGDLTIDGQLNAYSEELGVGSGFDVQIITAGNLTLASGATIETTDADITLVATGGNFTNLAGSPAITNHNSGRALIYADNPTDSALGGLSFEPVYDRTYAANAPGTITATGNRILYRLAPILTLTADDLARLYGSANPTLTFSVDGLVGDDTAAQAFSGAPVLSTTATAGDDVGTAAITIAAGTVVASDYNYQIAFAPGTLTINPAPLTIRPDDLTRSFGTDNPTLTASFTGLVNGDTAADITGLTLSTAATASSPDGAYNIIASGATNANYTYTYLNGLLTVGASSVTIRAHDFTRFFGDANPTFTGTVSAPTGFDLDLITGLSYSSTATPTSGVGTYAIVPSVDTLDGVSFNLVNGVLTVDPRLLTITAGDVSRFYGSANPTFGGTLSGLASFHTAADIVGLSYSTTAAIDSDVGSYAITPTVGANPNYAITTTAGTLTIDPVSLTITAQDASKLFADLDPTFAADVEGLVLDQSLADLGTLAVTTPTGQLSDVGTYAITPAWATTTGLAGNYAVTFVPATFTVTPRPVSILVGDQSRSYGDANPSFSYSLSGTNPTGYTNLSLLDTTGLSLSTTATAGSDVGTYSITAGGITDANYAVTYMPGRLTVNPALLSVQVADAARLYGAANPTFTATGNGLKLSDTLADAIGTLSLSTAATAASNAGTYAINAAGSALSGNYQVSFVPGTLTVNRAPLFIAPELTSRLYGDANPTFTLSATGLVNGDTPAVIQGLSFAGPNVAAGVGSHTVSITSASAINYDLTFGTGTLNILARPLTITADTLHREYGELNPTLTATFAGLASFDTVDDITGLHLSTVATASSNVIAGGYGIQVTSDANANYAITYVPGRLIIDPAPLLLDLGNVTREYGDANPTPSASIATGFKLGDTFESIGLQIGTDATPTSDVGNYLYNATASSPNYDITVNGGTLNVTPAPIAVHVTDTSRLYGDMLEGLPSFTVDGLKFAADREGLIQIDDPADFRSDVGTYAFAGTLLDPNYTLTDFTGTLLVLPRPLTVAATATRFFGDENPTGSAFTLTGDFANGDLASDILGFATTTDLARGHNVGTYDVTAASTFTLRSNNYTLADTSAAVTIAPRPLNIEIAPIERYYGEGNPSFSLIGDTNLPTDLNTLDEVLRFTAPDRATAPGNYTIEAEIINANYTIGTLGFGNLAILKRPLTITVDNVARYYGDANPTFSAIFGGMGLPDFVDPASVLDLRTVVPTDVFSDAGHYLISMLWSSFDSDLYALEAFTPGVLSIFPRPVTLIVNDAELAVSPGTDPASIFDLSDVAFSVTGTNFANGETAAEQFGNLEYEVSDDPAAAQVGVPVDLNNYVAPDLRAFVGGVAGASDGESGGRSIGRDEGDDSTSGEQVGFIPVVIDGETTEVAVNEIEIGASDPGTIVTGDAVIFVPDTSIGTGETRVTRSIGISGGHLGTNRNYVVTAVTNGVLTVRNRTEIEEMIKLAEDAVASDASVEVRSISDYANDIGLLFSDQPEMTFEMILGHLTDTFGEDRGEGSLYYAIFGEEDVSPPFNAARIRAWMADLATNPEKRAALGGAMVGYLAKVQALPVTERSGAQNLLAQVVQQKFAEERDRTGNLLISRLEAFQRNNAAGGLYYSLLDEVETIKTRLAAAAQGFLDFESGSLSATETTLLNDILARSGDPRETADTLALIDQWIATREGGERAFIDDQIAGFREELLALQTQRADLREVLEDPTAEGATLYAGGMQGLFGSNVPYLDILGEARLDALDAKLANYDVLSGAIGGVTGGAVGGAGVAAAASTQAAVNIAKTIFPYVRSASAGAGRLASGPMALATFIIGSTERAFQVFQEDEQRIIFENLVGDVGEPRAFADIDFSPLPDITAEDYDPLPGDMQAMIQKQFLMDAMTSLLVGPAGGEG